MRGTKKKPSRTQHRHSDSPAAIAEAVADGKLSRRTYRLNEVAVMIGVSRWQIDKLIRNGELGTVKLGNSLRVVPAEELDQFLSSRFDRRPAQTR